MASYFPDGSVLSCGRQVNTCLFDTAMSYNCNFNSNGNAHISLLEQCASNGPDDGHVDRNR